MGYSYRNGGLIKDYWPDNDDNTIYLEGERSISEILDHISENFGSADLSNLTISAEYIQTSCLTYDRYDPSDYTTFTVIKRR